MQKRKTLVNGLVTGGIVENKLKAEKMLLDLGFSKDIRGEKLTLEDFAKLADYLGE